MPTVRQQLRERLQRGETIVAPGAYDPISARVVQSLGFPAVYTGGYITGAHTTITEPLFRSTRRWDIRLLSTPPPPSCRPCMPY